MEKREPGPLPSRHLPAQGSDTDGGPQDRKQPGQGHDSHLLPGLELDGRRDVVRNQSRAVYVHGNYHCYQAVGEKVHYAGL